MKFFKKNHIFVSLIVFVASTLYITHPLVFNLGVYITGFGDELLIAWIQNWVVHSLINDPRNIFNANIYFPYTNTLAYSDLFIVTSIISSIALLLTGQPVAISNFTILVSLVSFGFSIYLLSYFVTKDILASFLVGLLVIFSPAVLDKLVHIQVLAIAFVPFAILFFLLFLKKSQTRFLFLSIVAFVLQTYNSFLPGYFIVFALIIVTTFYYFQNKKKAVQLFSKKNILVLFLGFCSLIPIVIPYYTVSHEFNYVRDIRETIHLALQPEDFFFSNNYSRLQPFLEYIQPRGNYPNADFKPGFIGGVFTFLVIFSFIYFMKRFAWKNWMRNALFTTALFGLIMSLGPFMHFFRGTIHNPFPIPLPYAIFYYVVPGFQGMRNAARWEMLFIIAIAVVIAIILQCVFKKITLKKKLLIYAILVIGIVTEYNFPIQYQNVPQKKEFPRVYSWLQTTPKETVIIEMPIYTWEMQPYVMNENMREYYATIHFRKMVNGASGFSPPPWQDMTRSLLLSFPNDASIAGLSQIHVDYIIIHKNEYNILHREKYQVNNKGIPNGDDVISRMNKNASVQFVKKLDEDYIYKIIK